MGDRIRDEINSVIDELDLDAKCYSYGSIWSLYFTRKVDNYRDVIDMASQGKGFHKDVAYRNHMLNNGIYLQPNYTPRFFTSAAHTDEEINRTIDSTRDFLTSHADALR